MSINKLISINNSIIDARNLLGLDHDKDNPVFTRWAELAEREIGSPVPLERKRTVLDIHGCAACLPNDAEILEGALLGDYGCDCGDLFNSIFCSFSGGTVFINNTNANLSGFLIVDALGPTGDVPFGFVDYQIQNNKIVFTNNYDNQKVTIQYKGVVTDCDGFLMIGENHVRAVTAYIVWMYYLRKKIKGGADLNQVSYWDRQWNQLCSHARADDAVLTPPDRDIIASMQSDPFAGRGLSVGMRTTFSFGSNYAGF